MIFRKMLGGGKFPAFADENRAQYDNTTLPQLQLIGHVPVQYGGNTGIVNYTGPTDNRKRVREEEPMCVQHKLGMSLNNNNICQDGPGHIGLILNPNPVSTGLRLFCEKESRSASVTSTCVNMKNTLPDILLLGNDALKMEMDRQTEEFGKFIKLQEDNILNGVREIHQRHTFALLSALEKGVNRKLQEKDLEIENINRKNKELEERLKQVTMEAHSWHNRAKHNESVANVLKSNIQQLVAQGTAHGREGSGDSEVDDALSCSNQELEYHRLICRACKGKRVSVLLFPCRHLCLCADCEGLVNVCPVCRGVKTASVPVYM